MVLQPFANTLPKTAMESTVTVEVQERRSKRRFRCNTVGRIPLHLDRRVESARQ
jgi:hypothetical protein